jgi:predicted O-methyltransferase YrrM
MADGRRVVRASGPYAFRMDMNAERLERTRAYVCDVFARGDEQQETLMERAIAAGIPAIAVSPDTGRMLQMLASMTNGGRGARLALELGTLAGYSALWITRGLAPDGRLVTVEPEARHADFAQREFERSGLADRIQIRRTTGLEALEALLKERGLATIDLVFVDALKGEYPDYFRAARRLIAPGGVIAFDNALGTGDWWIDAPAGSNASRDAVDRLNRMIAADEAFVSVCVMNGSGLTVAWRRV